MMGQKETGQNDASMQCELNFTDDREMRNRQNH